MTELAKDALASRSKRYGIQVRDDHRAKLDQHQELPDSQWGDPVNYFYPVSNEVDAVSARNDFAADDAYDAKSRNTVRQRLNRLFRKYGVDPIARPKSDDDEMDFSGNMVGRIQLEDVDEQGRVIIPASRVATFDHPWYGTITFDDDLFESFIDNFQTDVVGTAIPIDAEHRHNGALGGMALAWVEDLSVRDNILYLHAKMTDTGKKYLGNEYKYASIEYMPNFIDQETGIDYGATLVACAATNNPFVHRNPPMQTFSSDDTTTATNHFIFVMPEAAPAAPILGKGEATMPDVKEASATPQPVQQLQLPDGTVITAQDIQRLQREVNQTKRQLKLARIDSLANEASDRGISPVVIEAAKQVLAACEMEAEATIILSLEPGEAAQKVNFFEAVAYLLSLVPGRLHPTEVTYVTEGVPPEPKNTNPYDPAHNQTMTLEEAERKAREFRQRNGRQLTEADLEL